MAPALPPEPGQHPAISRDYEYRRHGTFTLMAGLDLRTGHVHSAVVDRHRSREFIAFLRQLDAAYPAPTPNPNDPFPTRPAPQNTTPRA
ncbi:MAG: hypothetical protein OXE58_08505 [Acidobacteria bacterium]|nr:hypothetical protein [Acidobacteriota bacterium]